MSFIKHKRKKTASKPEKTEEPLKQAANFDKFDSDTWPPGTRSVILDDETGEGWEWFGRGDQFN